MVDLQLGNWCKAEFRWHSVTSVTSWGSSWQWICHPRISPSVSYSSHSSSLSLQAIQWDTTQGRNAPACCEISTEVTILLLTQETRREILWSRAQHIFDTQYHFLSGWMGLVSNLNSIQLRAPPSTSLALPTTSTQCPTGLRLAYTTIIEEPGRAKGGGGITEASQALNWMA